MEADDETFMVIKEIDPPPPDPEVVKNVQTLEEGKGQIEEKEKESLSGKCLHITHTHTHFVYSIIIKVV